LYDEKSARNHFLSLDILKKISWKIIHFELLIFIKILKFLFHQMLFGAWRILKINLFSIYIWKYYI
jgi:hypothetical protein